MTNAWDDWEPQRGGVVEHPGPNPAEVGAAGDPGNGHAVDGYAPQAPADLLVGGTPDPSGGVPAGEPVGPPGTAPGAAPGDAALTGAPAAPWLFESDPTASQEAGAFTAGLPATNQWPAPTDPMPEPAVSPPSGEPPPPGAPAEPAPTPLPYSSGPPPPGTPAVPAPGVQATAQPFVADPPAALAVPADTAVHAAVPPAGPNTDELSAVSPAGVAVPAVAASQISTDPPAGASLGASGASSPESSRGFEQAWGAERSVALVPYQPGQAAPSHVETEQTGSRKRLLLISGAVVVVIAVAGLVSLMLIDDSSADNASAVAGGEAFVWPEPAASDEEDLTSVLLGDVPSTTTTTVPPTTLPVPVVEQSGVTSTSAPPAESTPAAAPTEHVVTFNVVGDDLLDLDPSKLSASVGDLLIVKPKDADDQANNLCRVETDPGALEIDKSYAEEEFDNVRFIVKRKGTATVVVNCLDASSAAESITVEVG